MYTRARRAALLSTFVLVLILVWLPHARGQEAQSRGAEEPPFRISYELSMPRPETHLFEVRVAVSKPEDVGHVDFQMPRWSPGRYGVFDFARNVQEVTASGRCLPRERCGTRNFPVTRVDTQTWRVGAAGTSEVELHYKVFADDLSGTFSQLDARHANYNGHSVFVYVAGHKQDPVALRILAPDGWKIINGYTARPDQTEFQFPNYDVFADAPTEVAPDWTVDTFKVDGKTYRVVVHSFGDEKGKRGRLARDIEKVVREQVKMMNGAPDYEQYTFLFHFDPTARTGDGMEHLNSTQIILTRSLGDEGAYDGALSTAAHEFFHVWNVKRLRPAGLGPWDFTRPVETRGLWIAEGFTNYYETLSMRRAGVIDDEQLLRAYSNTINGVENSPGNRLMSAEESSLLASFLDRGTSEQRTNLQNTSVSYYPKGETLALVLDLLIRGRSKGRASLDDVLRRMYDEFYVKAAKDSYYLRGRAYTPEDFERVAAEVAGASLNDFFRYSVRAPGPAPYDEALAAVGLRLTRAPSERPHAAGISLDSRDASQPRVGNVRPGSAAERAGVRQGDVLVRLGESEVTAAGWADALGAFETGDRVPLTVRRVGATVNVTLTLGEPDSYHYSIEKAENATAAARAMREAWLTGRR